MHPIHLTPHQQRLWQLEQSHPGRALVNATVTLRLHGALSSEALAQAVKELGRRHAVLRSELLMLHGRAYWVVKGTDLRLEAEDHSRLEGHERARAVSERRAREGRRPFDHSRGPLVRFLLFREDLGRHDLMIVASRVLLDEGSLEAIVAELAELYSAQLSENGAGKRVPEPSLPPAPALEERPNEIAYFARRLAGMPRSIDLPLDQLRPKRLNGSARQATLVLEAEQTSRLRALASERGVSLATVSLAAVQLVLQRYTNQGDFGIVFPTNGRELSAQERMMGVLENAVTLRSDLPSGGTFGDLLWRVESTRQGALAHATVPYEQVARAVLGERDLDELPLHQVVCRLRDARAAVPRFGPLEIERIRSFQRTNTAELEFWLEDHGDSLSIGVEGAAQLFEAETVARLCRSFGRVLEAAPDSCALPFGEVPALSARDRRQLLELVSEEPWDESALVHRLFERRVDTRPDAVALLFEDQALTYRELDERANRIAHALRERGVGPDTLVGVCLRRGPDLVAALLGVLKAGAAYVPLDPDYPAERLAYKLEDSRARVLVTTSALSTRLARKPELLLLDERESLAARPWTRLAHGEHSEQLAYVIYTSGSTGKPKGVMVEHRNVVSFFKGMELSVGLDDQGTWLAGTSVSFDISVLEILGSLCHGRRLLLLGEAVLGQVENPEYTIPALIERHAVTHFQCTPSQARILLLDEAGRKALSRLQKLLVGGEALPRELCDDLTSLVRGEVWNMYGPTETTVWSTAGRVDATRPIDVGRPIANTAVLILDANGELVPPGAPGEIYITGPGVTRGYLGKPEVTEQRFVENTLAPELGARLYRTGDLARLGPDGRIVHLGRNDHQVKVRGHRIELSEIESAALTAAGVRDAVVVARGKDADARLVAYVTGDARFQGSDALRAHLRSLLPDFMLPAAIVRLEAMPLTPNGKIDRNALPDPALAADGSGDRVPPRSEQEEKLCQIWREALGVADLGVTDDFFDLGGHSLVAVRISNEVHKVFGVRLPLSVLFEARTVEGMARRLQGQNLEALRRVAPAWTTLVPMQPRGSLPPFFCVAGLGGNPMNLRHLAAELGDDQPFFGLQLRGVDGQRRPHRSVHAMVTEFFRDIRSLQPRGPYYLGGYSAGGLAAYELAQTLRALGEEVGLVVLLDTMSPSAPSWTFDERLAMHLRELSRRGAEYVANRVWARLGAELTRLNRRARARLARRFPFEFRHDAVWQATDAAAKSYRPEPYEGDVLLLQADSELNPDEGLGYRPDPTNGWGDLVKGRFEVVEIASSHIDIVSEEASKHAADALRSALRRARARFVAPEPSSDPANVPDPTLSPPGKAQRSEHDRRVA